MNVREAEAESRCVGKPRMVIVTDEFASSFNVLTGDHVTKTLNATSDRELDTGSSRKADEGQAFENGSLTCCQNQSSKMSVTCESGGDFARF